MTDEKYTFIEDVREKKKTATGAHHKRTHCGKGGAIRFPSDFKSKKELRAMNGEVKSYKLNDPVSWAEFKAWPDDIKITYVTALRKKYNVSDTNIAKMMGVCQATFSEVVRRLGIKSERKGRAVWDKDGWYAWLNGVPVEDKEETVEEPATCGEEMHTLTPDEMPHLYGPACFDFRSDGFAFGMEKKSAPLVPCIGQMELEGTVEEILNTLKMLLADSCVKLTVAWAVKRDG